MDKFRIDASASRKLSLWKFSVNTERSRGVEVIKATPNPQQVIWLAMHQDYAKDFVWDQRDRVMLGQP